MPARIWLGPEPNPVLRDAIERAGAQLVDLREANAIVWKGGPPERIRDVLHPGIEWVQLDSTGVDRWIDAGALDRERRWTAVRDVFAPDVAEHAVAFVLAAVRGFPQAARRRAWGESEGRPLAGRTVGIVGAARSPARRSPGFARSEFACSC